jgi:hypothetical protein
LIALALMGCQQDEQYEDFLDDLPPPSVYLRFEDRLAARMIQWGIPWRYPCTYTETVMGTEGIASLPTEQCEKLSLQRRFKGLWNDEFEGSRFCPAPAEECSFISPGEHIWLSFAERSYRVGERKLGVYAIEFVGRQTLYPGLYGHMGGSDEEVIVDHVISMNRIGDTAPISRAEFDAYMNGLLRARDRERAERRASKYW